MNTGDTVWVLVSAALVMLMTPGLAFFYGGMVRHTSVLNMLMMNFMALAVVGVLWGLYGYGEAFGSIGSGGGSAAWLIGGAGGVPRSGLALTGAAGHRIPVLAFAMFQLMFAVITPALISGAVADRVRFWPWVAFVAVWVTAVYFPVAHWVFSPGGWIAAWLHALDFAGGTAVHINAGAAALALALLLGRRGGRGEEARPHNVPFVLLGASLLWFGWYGFNAGSALGANATAALAFTTTTLATAAAMLGWLAVEALGGGRPTTLGAASGAVAGLVAITPGCAYVDPAGALAIGAITGVGCALAVRLTGRFGLDDSLDVVGVHLVGGLLGTMLVGLFASTAANPSGADGLLHGGGVGLLGRQAVASFSVMGYSFVLTLAIGWVVQRVLGFRADPEAATVGADVAEHAETAYELRV